MIPDGTVLLEDDTDDFGADLDSHDDMILILILMGLSSAREANYDLTLLLCI